MLQKIKIPKNINARWNIRLVISLSLIYALLIQPGLMTYMAPPSLAPVAERIQGWMPQPGQALAAKSAAPHMQTNTITGSVFLDIDLDGAQGAGESLLTGVSGITVTAYDSANAVAGSATISATTGQYSLAVTGTGPFRLEFTGIPSWLKEGFVGADNASTVQFADDGDVVYLAVHDPANYCQDDPEVASWFGAI